MSTKDKKIIFAAAHAVINKSSYIIEVYDMMNAAPKFLYEYDTGIKYDDVEDGEYRADAYEYEHDGFPAILTDVSPDGRILVYSTTMSLHMINFDESYQCISRKEYETEANEYTMIESLKGRCGCVSCAFRYLTPELGILSHNDGSDGCSVIYRNLNTGELKLHSNEITELDEKFPDDYEQIISELSLVDYCGKAYLFEPKLNIHENEYASDYPGIRKLHTFDKHDIYAKMLEYNTSIGKKYNIINDGKSVRITINYKGFAHEVTLVPEDCY